ncbi:MAG: 2OG-Fe(II) oxygenase [Myxococcales bacterium]|nr:2OG-Fe(II) oxygenase [Myxococcales bacterium]
MADRVETDPAGRDRIRRMRTPSANRMRRMARWIDFAGWDVTALAAAWRGARPFPHVIVDQLLSDGQMDELRVGMAAEPHWPDRGELQDFMASGPHLQCEILRSLLCDLGGAEGLECVAALTGKGLRSVEMRSYVYLAGGRLLPHADWREGVGRQVAFALYLSHPGACRGGELELFECTVENGEIVATASAAIIEHLPGRLVLFDVSPTSLHQVREVMEGYRLSVAGWFT